VFGGGDGAPALNGGPADGTGHRRPLSSDRR
jgi:hypothetical protein